MTILLAVETSSDLCSVALYRDGEVFDVTEKAPREHTQKLLPMIDKVLANQDVALADLDAIAYGKGPGSFTGLRISLGMVQGLAYGLDIPLIPVSTLETISIQASEMLGCQPGDKIFVANDARMGEIYGCLYRCDNGGIVPLTEEFVLAPAKLLLLPEVVALDGESFFAVGSGWALPEMAAFLSDRKYHNIQATAPGLMAVASENLAKGAVVDADKAEPTYLRDSVAWKKRERIRQS